MCIVIDKITEGHLMIADKEITDNAELIEEVTSAVDLVEFTIEDQLDLVDNWEEDFLFEDGDI